MNRISSALVATSLVLVTAEIPALSIKIVKQHQFKVETTTGLTENQKAALTSTVEELKSSCFRQLIEVVVIEETTSSTNTAKPTKTTAVVAEYLASLGVDRSRIFEGETPFPEVGLVKIELICTPAQ